MIKVKLFEIMDAKDAIIKLMKFELPVRTAYKLSKLAQALQVELNFVEEQRKKLFEQYGTKQEDNTIKVTPEKVSEFQGKMTDLFNVEVDINSETIAVEELEEARLSPNDLSSMMKFLGEK